MDDRKSGIGGSDVGSIVGCRGAYETPWSLWALKIGLNPPKLPNEAMEMGHLMEPTILRLYESRTGSRLLAGLILPGLERDARETIRHPLHPWAMGHLDGIVSADGLIVVVDAKNTQRRGLGDDEELADVDAGEVPEPWWLQVHHYAWILRAHGASVAPEAHVACLVNGSAYRTLAVPLDLDWYEADVVPQLEEFWRCVVDKREPPAPTVHPVPAPVALDAAVDAALQYLECAAFAKSADAAKDAARDELWRIIDAAGSPSRCIAGPASISAYPVAGRQSADFARLASEFPEAYAACVSLTAPSRAMRVTPRKV